MPNALQTFFHDLAQGGPVNTFMRARQAATIADYRKRQQELQDQQNRIASNAEVGRRNRHADILPVRQMTAKSGALRSAVAAADFADRTGGGAEARKERERMRQLAKDPQAYQALKESGYDVTRFGGVGEAQVDRQVKQKGREANAAAAARKRQRLDFLTKKGQGEQLADEMAAGNFAGPPPRGVQPIYRRPPGGKLTDEQMRLRGRLDAIKEYVRSQKGFENIAPQQLDEILQIVDRVSQGESATGATGPAAAPAASAPPSGLSPVEAQIVQRANELKAGGMQPAAALARARLEIEGR